METNRRDRYSAFVLIAVIAAIVAIVLITNSPPEKSIEYITSTDAQKSQQEYIAQLVASINDPWSDSYAQWLVAITSLAAVIVSSWAVILVRDTLQENRKATNAAESAVVEARRASDAQLRPYIIYDSVEIDFLYFDGGPDQQSLMGLDVSFRNCGLSPAILTAASSSIYAPHGSGTWRCQKAGWKPTRIVIGPNQREKIRFEGTTIDRDGTYSWFTIGILIWYETLSEWNSRTTFG